MPARPRGLHPVPPPRQDLTEPEPGPPLLPEHVPARRERKQAGCALRQKVPRSSHAGWKAPSDRADPLALLEESNRGRLPSLVPLRHGRMLQSPFAFLRGSACVMARDLARTPDMGVRVQACGDAHLGNFGMYATPERNLVFDLNDFDETLPAPWEWDLKRLVASVWVAGRCNGDSEAQCEEAVATCLASYRDWMHTLSHASFLEVWYARVDADDLLETLKDEPETREQTLARAWRRTQLATLPKLTECEEGRRRIIEDPPLVVRPPREHAEELAEVLQAVGEGYLASLPAELSTLVRRYQAVDVVRKVVGVGSVGLRCYVVLLFGAHETDPLFLQVKEAPPSVLEPFAGASSCPTPGRRVVEGQRLMQAASDIFLGWCQVAGRSFYVRQLRDMKSCVDVATLSPRGLRAYASVCGWALARAHARGGDAAVLRGYIGKSDTFDKALCAFARDYADQTERDYALFQQAVKSGRLQAQEE